jgi:hypothetical protein
VCTEKRCELFNYPTAGTKINPAKFLPGHDLATAVGQLLTTTFLLTNCWTGRKSVRNLFITCFLAFSRYNSFKQMKKFKKYFLPKKVVFASVKHVFYIT